LSFSHTASDEMNKLSVFFVSELQSVDIFSSEDGRDESEGIVVYNDGVLSR
jgi:hypothetical protein